MKIQGYLAGLGVAGKIALGIGVAAAATTGAAATGVIPVPGVHHHAAHNTPHHSSAPTGVGGGTSGGSHGPSTGPVVTPTTTEQHAGDTPTTVGSPTAPPTTVANEPTPTTVASEPTPTTTPYTPPPTTPPTTAPTNDNTQSITLSCASNGAGGVLCTWSGAGVPTQGYQLWRWTTGGNGSDYGPIYEGNNLSFTDTTGTPGTNYTYRVFTKNPDGTNAPFSNRVQVVFPG
jgi:hypothetical protein